MGRRDELTVVAPLEQGPPHNGHTAEVPYYYEPAYSAPLGAAGDYRTFNNLLTDIAQATRYDSIVHLKGRVLEATTLTKQESDALMSVLKAKWIALGELPHSAEEIEHTRNLVRQGVG
jgi:hypothetical protein